MTATSKNKYARDFSELSPNARKSLAAAMVRIGTAEAQKEREVQLRKCRAALSGDGGKDR